MVKMQADNKGLASPETQSWSEASQSNTESCIIERD